MSSVFEQPRWADRVKVKPSHGPKTRQGALGAITQALIQSGFRSLDAQARALGLSRSTAWTIIRGKHKRGRLQLNTTVKILANPSLPAPVRVVVEAYAVSVSQVSTRRRRWGE